MGATLAQESPNWSATFKKTFTDLPGVILGAIQGGGSVLGAAGASIGTSIMAKFNKEFGPAIEAALPFGIGTAVRNLLPMLGTLFGPALQKIGGLFRNLFGGPDADELAGRKVVSAFEQNVASMLTQQQKLEAGNESWKQTVVVVRDAYMAMGRTEAEALAAVDALWKSSKGGADAVNQAMKPIQEALDFVKQKSGETGLSFEELRAKGSAAADTVAGALGNTQTEISDTGREAVDLAQNQLEALRKKLEFADSPEAIRDVTTAIETQKKEVERLLSRIPSQVVVPITFDITPPDWSEIPDLARLGLPPITPMAEGGVGRVTRPTLFLAGEAGPEDFAFSGGGRRFGGHDSEAIGRGLLTEMEGLRRDLNNRLPGMVADAARHAVQTAGRRR